MPFIRAIGIVVAAPYSDRAVGVMIDFEIGWQKRCRAMMLRPVELNATGNPGAGKTDKGGFDDALVVNQIIAVGLVENRMNATTQFRQNHYAEELILEPDDFPLPVHRLLRDSICEWERIDFYRCYLDRRAFPGTSDFYPVQRADMSGWRDSQSTRGRTNGGSWRAVKLVARVQSTAVS